MWRAAQSGRTDWDALALLYEGLVQRAPSLGALVGRATALGFAQGPAQGLAALDAIEPALCENFQPAWAARAHLLTVAGRCAEALAALQRAILLSRGPRVRAELELRRRRLRLSMVDRAGS